MVIFRKEMSATKKYVFSLLITLAAFVAYFALFVVLTLAFPDFFKEK